MRRITSLVISLTAVCMLAGCSRDPEARARRFVESGQHYFDKGQYEAATIQFRRAVQANPQSADAHYHLGMANLRLRKLPEAYKSLTKTIQLDQRSIPALVQLAGLELMAKRTQESRSLSHRVLELDRANLTAGMLLGEASFQEEKYDEAVQEFKNTAQIAPSDPRVQARIADCQVLLKSYTEAIKSYELALQNDSAFVSAYVSLSQVYRILNDSEREITTLERAIHANPKVIAPYTLLAGAYLRHGSEEKVSGILQELRFATGGSAPASLAIADFYRSLGSIQDARTELRSMLRKYRTNDAARSSLIEVDIDQQEWDEAERLTADLLNQQPNNPEARLFKSRLLFVRGKQADAISALEQLIHDAPDIAMAHFYLGLAYADQGQNQRAIASFNDALKHNPELMAAYVSLGEAYLRQGNAKLAIESVERAFGHNPQYIAPLLLQANAYLQLGEDGAAEAKLRAIPASQLRNPVVLERLGLIALRRRRFSDAEIQLEDCLRINPDYVLAMADLLQLYAAQYRHNQIIARVTQQIARSSKPSALYEMLGDIYLQQGKDASAEQAFIDALKHNPTSDGACLKLAQVYANSDRLPQAIESVKKVLQRHTNYVAGYVLVGTYYEKSGASNEAKMSYEKAISLAPDYAPALNNLAWLYCENGGNLDLALSMAQHAKASLPADPSISDTLAWIEYRKGLYSSAAEELRRLVRQVPAKGVYDYHLGMTLLKVGDVAEAKHYLQRAITANANANYAQNAKAALAQLNTKSL